MTLIEPWTTEWDFKVSVWVPDPITPDRMGTLAIGGNRNGPHTMAAIPFV
ncbi:uncharacterized protein METZ01_LOCUS314735 [marine metagenome]|uniref:Uncharacterized protein n=1 Tax=marine metagenome TaxID=408172 RepID=A0A382NQN0_9ZZZZ